MIRKVPLWAIALTLPFAVAGNADAATPVSAVVSVSGSVEKACHLGSPTNSDLNVGTLANLSDGTLMPIAAQSTTITGSYCNAGSTISVSATPLVAQNYSGTLPSGWTKAVNYTATASGWTGMPAAFTTTGDTSGSSSPAPPDSKSTTDPTVNVITIGVANFITPSGGSRLVADPNYSGTITVTVTVTP